MKEDKLKSCPFCGAEAYVADTWDTTKYVQCTVCGCRTLQLKNKLDVIEIWNRRAVPKAAKRYEKELMKEINADREAHGKKPFDDTKSPETKEKTQSTTDPESGVFHKGEHKKCFAYNALTACDRHGYILDVTINAGTELQHLLFGYIWPLKFVQFQQII